MTRQQVVGAADCCGQQFVFGRSGKRISTVSLSSHNNLAVIDSLVRERRPNRSLEIGLALGGSACLLAKWHKASGAAPSGQHVAIDPFQPTVWDDAGTMALQAAELDAFVTIICEFSSVALAQYVRLGKTFDFIYIDGSHLFEDVFLDVYFASRLLTPGGILLLDDSTDRHVAKVIRFMRANMRGSLKELDLTRYRPAAGVKARLRYAAGKAFGRVQLTGFELVGDVTRPWNTPFINF